MTWDGNGFKEPVIDDMVHRWVHGEVSSEEFFAWAKANDTCEAHE